MAAKRRAQPAKRSRKLIISDDMAPPVTGGIYASVSVKTWSEYRGILMARDGWVFRGHSDATWKLETSLERLNRDRLHSQPGRERLALREFQRRAHHFASSLPRTEGYTFEWLALLRHHGGPTRLLDFTTSPYVAAYFAMEDADPTADCAVFAVDRRRLNQTVLGNVHARSQLFSWITRDNLDELAEAIFDDDFPLMPAVVSGEPYRMNERMAAQQGVFLIPNDPKLSFERNLLGSFGVEGAFDWETVPLAAARRAALLKIYLNPELRGSAMQEFKAMNISAATLYPGLDGFARSLAVKMRFG